MKQPAILAVLTAILPLLLCFSVSAQSAREVIVIEITDFDTQKNMDIYTLFDDDEEVTVINSCDALGWVVLKANQTALSKAMVKAYVNLKIAEVLSDDGYTVVEDKQAIDVLEDCRAEMLRQTQVE